MVHLRVLKSRMSQTPRIVVETDWPFYYERRHLGEQEAKAPKPAFPIQGLGQVFTRQKCWWGEFNWRNLELGIDAKGCQCKIFLDNRPFTSERVTGFKFPSRPSFGSVYGGGG